MILGAHYATSPRGRCLPEYLRWRNIPRRGCCQNKALYQATNFHSKYIISTVENVFEPVRSTELWTSIFLTEEQSSSRRE